MTLCVALQFRALSRCWSPFQSWHIILPNFILSLCIDWVSRIGNIPQSTVCITLCLWIASTKSDLEVSSEGGICSPFAFYSIVVSHTWAGRGNGFGLLLQRKFGWVRWIQCGWRVDIATNIKTCQWQQEGRIFFFFFLMLAREIVLNSN